jgi:hypothetical protein
MLAALAGGVLLHCAAMRLGGERPADFAIAYHWSRGSVPPPYHYEYSIEVAPSGRGKMVMQPGYDEHERWPVEFDVSPEELDRIYRLMVRNDLFTANWTRKSGPQRSGGTSQTLDVEAGGRGFAVPSDLAADLRDRADAICEAVRKLVPKEVWDSLVSRHDKYERNHR